MSKLWDVTMTVKVRVETLDGDDSGCAIDNAYDQYQAKVDDENGAVYFDNFHAVEVAREELN